MTTLAYRAMPTMFDKGGNSRMKSPDINDHIMIQSKAPSVRNNVIKLEPFEECTEDISRRENVKMGNLPIYPLILVDNERDDNAGSLEQKQAEPNEVISSKSSTAVENNQSINSSSAAKQRLNPPIVCFPTSSHPTEVDEKSVSSTNESYARKGKWTPEEEAYTTRIIHDFTQGYLPLSPGTTLRTYLADKLNCDPMRITKKFAGPASIGKQVFAPCEKTPENLSKMKESQRELARLEKRFKQRTTSSKLNKNKFHPNLIAAPSTLSEDSVGFSKRHSSDRLSLLDGRNGPLIRRNCKPSYSSKYYGPSTQDVGLPGFCPPQVVYSRGDGIEIPVEGTLMSPFKPTSSKRCPPAKCRIDEGYHSTATAAMLERSDGAVNKFTDSDAGSLLLFFSQSAKKQGTESESSDTAQSLNELEMKDFRNANGSPAYAAECENEEGLENERKLKRQRRDNSSDRGMEIEPKKCHGV